MKTDWIRRLLCVLGALPVALLTAASLLAQTQGPPNALQGFSKNRHEPIRIESQSLEVRDKDRTATFIDNVKLTQGDTTLESRRLTVYYNEPSRGEAASAAKRVSSAAGTQQIRRLEAMGGVVVTQREHTAVGDQGIYDMGNNSMTLIGNVVVTQGQNVIRGDRLSVDLVTGVSRVESKSGGQGRVQGVFLPGGPSRPAGDNARPAPAQPASRPGRAPTRGSEREPGQPSPARPPIRIN